MTDIDRIYNGDFIGFFEEQCDLSDKFYLPKESDKDIGDRLVKFYHKHYDLDLLVQIVETYVKTNGEPLTVEDFAIKAGMLREQFVAERLVKQEFNDKLKETQERMERYK